MSSLKLVLPLVRSDLINGAQFTQLSSAVFGICFKTTSRENILVVLNEKQIELNLICASLI